MTVPTIHLNGDSQSALEAQALAVYNSLYDSLEKLHDMCPNSRQIQYLEKTKDNRMETRYLTDHKINPTNDIIDIQVLDEPGAGGACHLYGVFGLNMDKNPSADYHCKQEQTGIRILFQNGPIPETGVNGLTHEVLLAIVADRLRSFQKGPYACKANACALTHIEEAQHWLQQRTIERMRRGVEGTHVV